jgi:hypothetical protein
LSEWRVAPSEAEGVSHHPELRALLTSLSGPHDACPAVDVPPMTSGADELLSAHRAAYRLGREAREAWQLVDLREREMARLQMETTQAMDGVQNLVEHLANVL